MKTLISEIQAKQQTHAEMALKTKNKSQMDMFENAGPKIEFAAFSWDPRKLSAPKNTRTPPKGNEVKPIVVYLTADIFDESFEVMRGSILQTMQVSPQWVFMVLTVHPEHLAGVDW